tara:strand:+ start:7764 stop:8003 length:240 start_codon:yes stop_codon:yes gene_type:complete
LPVVSEPWFNLPIVTEWTWDKADGTIAATSIEQRKVQIRDIPSVFNLPPEVLISMNAFDAYVAEEKQRQIEEAQANAKR